MKAGKEGERCFPSFLLRKWAMKKKMEKGVLHWCFIPHLLKRLAEGRTEWHLRSITITRGESNTMIGLLLYAVKLWNFSVYLEKVIYCFMYNIAQHDDVRVF